MVCGAVRFDHPAARNLVEILPAAIHMEAADSPQLERMQSTLRLMAAEARELRPGGEAVITRLGDILVIQAIRSWIENDPAAQTGGLGALQDRQIGRAISLIHRDPARSGRWRRSRASWRCHARPSRPLHGARGRAGDAVRDALADARRGRRPPRGRRDGGRAGEAARLPLGSSLRASVQARRRRAAGSRQTGRGRTTRVRHGVAGRRAWEPVVTR